MDIELQELVGGALQNKFSESFEKVVENLKDPNTPYKNKREINIKLKFEQNESRDDVKCEISVAEKLASNTAIETKFAMEKDFETGQVVVEEYGRGIKGQMTLDEVEVDGKTVDTETGEIKEDNVVDFQQAK